MGKNFIVGQSGGPTAVINSSLAGVAATALEHCRANGGIVYGMQHGIQGFARNEVVDLGAQLDTEAAIALLKTTPAAALGSCRRRLPAAADEPAVYEDIFRRLEELDIGYFFYIGGNDSMDTVAKLSEYTKNHDYEMRIMGVPKTIDNDLVGTDHTPGYGSAAKYIAVTLSEIIRDCAVYTKKAVTIVEIMGRDAGWLTAASALGRAVGMDAPDLVYLPERPFDMDEFFADIKKVLQERRREMCFTMRWYDLKRLNANDYAADDVTVTREYYEFNAAAGTVLVDKGVKTFTLEPNSRHYAIPIPKTEIAIGKGAIEQNVY